MSDNVCNTFIIIIGIIFHRCMKDDWLGRTLRSGGGETVVVLEGLTAIQVWNLIISVIIIFYVYIAILFYFCI